MDTHKKKAGLRIAKLGRVENVAALFEEYRGHPKDHPFLRRDRRESGCVRVRGVAPPRTMTATLNFPDPHASHAVNSVILHVPAHPAPVGA
jgi:hypothetical protein